MEICGVQEGDGVVFFNEILSNLNAMSADEVIQSMGRIYEQDVDREQLFQYPQFLQDVIFIIDLDTELSLEGIGGLLENRTEQYVPHMTAALRRISANGEADTLEKIWRRYQRNPGDEEIDHLSNGLYLYTGFDIWALLEAYVCAEKAAV